MQASREGPKRPRRAPAEPHCPEPRPPIRSGAARHPRPVHEPRPGLVRSPPQERGAVGTTGLHRCTAQCRQGPMLPIPSTRDTTRARMADHIASPCCQRSSYKLPRRCDAHQERERANCLDFSTVDSYATNFRASFVGHSALTQADLEEKIGLAGGDIFHAALEPDQSWAAWPMLGCGDCPAAVKGPDSCSAGAHRATRHRHAGPQRSARNGA